MTHALPRPDPAADFAELRLELAAYRAAVQALAWPALLAANHTFREQLPGSAARAVVMFAELPDGQDDVAREFARLVVVAHYRERLTADLTDIVPDRRAA